jgi:hypothetical protein
MLPAAAAIPSPHVDADRDDGDSVAGGNSWSHPDAPGAGCRTASRAAALVP